MGFEWLYHGFDLREAQNIKNLASFSLKILLCIRPVVGDYKSLSELGK